MPDPAVRIKTSDRSFHKSYPFFGKNKRLRGIFCRSMEGSVELPHPAIVSRTQPESAGVAMKRHLDFSFRKYSSASLAIDDQSFE